MFRSLAFSILFAAMFPWGVVAAVASAMDDGKEIVLFDGHSFEGWEGDTEKTWRIEDHALVAGSLTEMVPRNEFLATIQEYENFELTLRYKLEGSEGFVNGGVQFRTKRIPDHHEVSGYQADLGAGFDGALYDESRRNRILAKPDEALIGRIVKRDDWNHYRIVARGPRIQLYLNGELTVDYLEEDASIPQKGIIALQVHGDGKTIVRYKDIRIHVLAD